MVLPKRLDWHWIVFGVSSVLLAVAFSGALAARLAIAGSGSEKTIFLSGTVGESLDVQTQFDAQSGVLSLDPKGSQSEALKVDVLSVFRSTGRSPASVGGQTSVVTSLVKSLLLDQAHDDSALTARTDRSKRSSNPHFSALDHNFWIFSFHF